MDREKDPQDATSKTALELVVDSFKLKVGGLYIPGNMFFSALKKLKC
jgi:hypothetical protein